jgi:hypothetical protein
MGKTVEKYKEVRRTGDRGDFHFIGNVLFVFYGKRRREGLGA